MLLFSKINNCIEKLLSAGDSQECQFLFFIKPRTFSIERLCNDRQFFFILCFLSIVVKVEQAYMNLWLTPLNYVRFTFTGSTADWFLSVIIIFLLKMHPYVMSVSLFPIL